MRKIFILQLLLTGDFVQAQIKVPDIVSIAFTKQFADAKNVKWGKENAKEYEADFNLNGVKMSANYDLQGNWKETETEIAVKDLPQAILSAIKTKYPSATISGADKVERAAHKIIYEADIKINGKKKEVELFPNGKFVK
ncbi:MAG TPA: PepSY-like domain-containing protein [Puia sp.]|jgi:hypothetical protein|nr:PepSY-like domain-containing protein [Puia sp.]